LHTEGHCQEITIESSAEQVHGIQRAVHDAMARCGFDDDECFAVKLAVEESVINAMKHGNKFQKERKVRVCFEVDAEKVVIKVKDEGVGFNPETVPDPTCDENLAKPNGRGIMLMRAYMDDIRYSECGTEVTMLKRRKA
jgi:serine/threonine-protein kinase RsbW